MAVDFDATRSAGASDNECERRPRCGPQSREIVRTHTAARAQLLIVDFRHTLLDVIDRKQGGYVSSPVAPSCRRVWSTCSRRGCPPRMSPRAAKSQVLVVGSDICRVDDYDLGCGLIGQPADGLARIFAARKISVYGGAAGVLLGRCTERKLFGQPV